MLRTVAVAASVRIARFRSERVQRTRDAELDDGHHSVDLDGLAVAVGIGRREARVQPRRRATS